MDNKTISYKRVPIPFKEMVLQMFANSRVSMRDVSSFVYGDPSFIKDFINRSDISIMGESSFISEISRVISMFESLQRDVLKHNNQNTYDPFAGFERGEE